LGVIVIAAGLYVSLFVVSNFWLLIITRAVIFSLIFLSITVITGMAGQISLCQASFAAVGSFGTAQLAQRFDLPVLLTMVIGAAMAAIVGALLAIPALRLGGIFLALATLAFALMFESIFVPLDWVSGGVLPTKVPRPPLFESDRGFLFLALGLLVVVSILVILVRKGTTGRYLDALRGSETAATSIGINPARARVVAFALSAGIAGLGGGLLAIQENQANYTANYSVLFGLLWLVIVVTIGARTVEGAVQAGLAIAFVPEILKALGLSPAYQFILFGLGAVTYARHPEGILEYNKRRSLETVQRFLTRGRQPPDGESGGGVVHTRPQPAPVVAGNPGGDR
jgi:ABC-type branched-subunit amino acid transport system permease subunit